MIPSNLLPDLQGDINNFNFDHEGNSRGVVVEEDEVVKYAKGESGIADNFKEWFLWNEVIEQNHLFVPVVGVSDDFTRLHMERAITAGGYVGLNELQRKLHALGWDADDIRAENVGIHKGRLKVLDYGFAGLALVRSIKFGKTDKANEIIRWL